jgi:fumarate hydratase class II
MGYTNRLEKKINLLKKDILKKDLLVGILTEHITFDKAVELAKKSNYDLRCLAIDNGRVMTEEQAQAFVKEQEENELQKENV